YYTARLKACGEFLTWFTDCRGNRPLIGDDDGGRVLPLFEDAPVQLQPGVKTFHDGGCTVGRHVAQGREIWLAMDHGGLGYGPLAAHGHADALAIWLHIG